MNILSQLTNVLELRGAWFIREIEKRSRIRKILVKKRYPGIGFSPGAGTVVEGFAWSVESTRNDLIAHILTRTFVASFSRKVLAIKATTGCLRRGFIVCRHEFGPLTMRKAVILRVQIGTLI